MTDGTPRLGFGTRATHGPAHEHDPDGAPRSHMPPIYQSSAFTFPDAQAGVDAFVEGGYSYSRKGNPTVHGVERHLALLESHPVPGAPVEPQGIDARFFGSGMAATSSVMLGFAAGGRMVCQDGIYGTTVAFAQMARRFGVQVSFPAVADLDALAEATNEDPAPALVNIETPANPLIQQTDIAVAAEIAHARGALLAVDSTFATPALQRPLAWGADLVLHSTTKFLSGHGVVLGGAVCGPRDLLKSHIDPIRQNLGGIADPHAAWITRLGFYTLDVRMQRHAANADALARALAEHPRVERLFRADPDGSAQLSGTCPLLSVQLAGGETAALEMIDRLRVATLAPTLGTLDTLVQHPYTMSHVVLPVEQRLALGIEPGIVRISVGIEDPEDLIADFTGALGD